MSKEGIPDFLYIGTSKAGSTWIYNALVHHPDIFVAAGKGIYFFDSHYDRGVEWYLQHFQQANGAKVLGEVSHSYLFSADACRRIEELNPQMRLMVCLREPVDRAFSAYLDRVKNGTYSGTFETALDEIPALCDRGRYATHLRPYLERFGRERLFVGVFDELRSAPDQFVERMYRFLGVSDVPLSEGAREKRMPAGRPRAKSLARLAKAASRLARRCGMKGLVGAAKRSVAVRNLLYRPFTPTDRPQLAEATRTKLKREFQDEIGRLDEMLRSNFRNMWNYD